MVLDAEELTCKPLDSLEELAQLLQDPPAWRSLVVPLVPHSSQALRNAEINPVEEHAQITVQNPQIFCHFDGSKVTDVKRHEKKNLPLTMICHDMANGYHDDSFVDGTGNYDAYTFYNWAGIDIFCYFSHHFITIPPLGWINVGHAHGVKVIGTIITEWADGEAIWDKILASESEWKSFASRLVAVAKIMKFDGWLLNVENKIAQPGALVSFVRFLHAALRQELPAALLLWYDSVTVDGHLHWQNSLNDKNHAFFSACDGIFTNYSWSEHDVAASAALAGGRLHDVFVGIDIWGRNFHGGGQFNTLEAVKVAHKHGCSLAIFAQAWAHEAIPEVGATASRLEQFLLRDRALWGSLWPLLSTRLPSQLPFQTSFCRGQGVKRRLYGEVLGPVPWYNLRHQQYQPNSSHGPHGYILTTLDNILKVSKHGIARDNTGIVRYREAFLEASSSNFNSTGMLNLAPTNHLIVINEHENQQDNEVEQEEPPPAPPAGGGGSGSETPKDVVTKVFNVKTRSSNALNSCSVQLSVTLQAHDPKSPATTVRYGLVSVPGEPECLQPHLADSFTGGSCLRVNGASDAAEELRTIRLFHCDFHIDGTLVVCVVTKTLPGFHDRYLDVILHLTDAAGQSGTARLVGGAAASGGGGVVGGGVGRHWRVGDVFPVNAGGGSKEQFRELQKYLLLNEPGFYVPTENAHGWLVRYYRARLGGARVTSVNARASGPVLLGHIGLCLMPGARGADLLMN